MRIITVRQPWAWAIMRGGKDVENRSRNIAGSYRGPVAIHAGMGMSPEAFDSNALMQGQRNRRFTHGAIVGVVDLVDAHQWIDDDACNGLTGADGEATCSQWGMADHWHLCLSNPRPFDTPIPAKGRLGLWAPDDELLTAINKAPTNPPREESDMNTADIEAEA